MLVDPMAIESDDAIPLGWTLRSFVFEKAFAQLATSLWWMFWGLLLQLFGAALAVAPLVTVLLQVGKPNAALVMPGLLLLVVGGIVLLIGEQKCLHLDVPLGMKRMLPGHNLLLGAYWCHLGSWLLRLARNWLGRGPVSLVLLPMQLTGFVLLLLFLRKTADVLARPDLKRLVDVIFTMGGAALVAGGSLVADRFLKLGILSVLPRPGALALLGLPIGLFVLTTGLYTVLLSRMASAAGSFAKFLGSMEPQYPDEDDSAADKASSS
jgi:hypothetical protein